MRKVLFTILLGLFLVAPAFGGEPVKTGVVKGAITIGGRPTSDVVVSVEGLMQTTLGAERSALGTKRALMDQQDVRFIPRVLPVLVGTTVDFPNNDKTWHNVFSKSEAKEFDLGLFPPGKSRSVAFDKPGIVRVLCNVHPSMEAYIVVKDHPYFSAADRRGNYQLNDLPLGKYRLEVWHPQLGTRTVSFHLDREGEVLVVDVELKKK